MPYIAQDRRARLDDAIDELCDAMELPGDFAYILFRLTYAASYLSGETSFAGFAEAIGVLETTKQEFYRRAIAGYEDRAQARNGDV